jgi:uncharacterized protein (DUF2267 family)
VSDPYATIEITRKVIMTLEEMMNDADAKAFLAEMAELDAMPLIKGGYCPQCEWTANNCHCLEYNLPLPE